VSVEVRPVRGVRELREFVALPYRLHANEARWVPPLRLERYLHLGRRTNPFFRHGEAEYFLARRGGRVVGRISAHIDHRFSEFHGNRWGLFGFFECVDDKSVASALVDAAEGWLRARGRDRIVGPMDFTLNDEGGILVEGFDLDPLVRQPWHPPFYRRLFEELGFEKAMDLLSWELRIEERDKVRPLIWRLADRLEERHGVRIRPMSRRSLWRDLQAFGEIYNEAWRRNWGFVPYDEHDLRQLWFDLQLTFDREWFMLAESRDGEPVGVAITIPDINRVLARMRGRLLPFGFVHYLRRRSLCDQVRIGFLGVKPAWQHTGVAAGLYAAHYRASERTGIGRGEASWILETNSSMNRALEALGARVVKRWRVYERPLG
jgi:GNAT superfamily N-acetyltransferase